MPGPIVYVPSRVGEGHFTDFQSPVAGDNGKVWAYNHSTGKFEPYSIPTISPGGSTTQVQRNLAGAFSGDSGFTYNGSGVATLSAALIAPVWRPPEDSTTALKVTKADGTTSVVTVNTTAGNVKISGTGALRGLIFDHHSLLNRDSTWLYLRNAADSDYSNFICGRFASVYYGSIGGGAFVGTTPPNGGLIVQGFTGLGTTSPVTRLHVYDTSDYTGAIQNVVTIAAISNGTPSNGFGLGVVAQLESSTTVDQSAGRLTWQWTDATHATRASKGQLSAYYTTSERPAVTWGANSTVALLSFYDVTTPIARQLLATGAGRTVDDVITFLQNLGLARQS